jgi:hypothetical protein
MEPRSCIFTGLRSRAKLEITQDKHSWTRAVPCSKTYRICREDRRYRDQLLPLELPLIRHFYEVELAAATGQGHMPFQDDPWVLHLQAQVKSVIGHEIARHEVMDDEAFQKALDGIMRARLDGIFSAD